jgi:Rrf2 family iron-sulfur cluster assembly transcriptional regulator
MRLELTQRSDLAIRALDVIARSPDEMMRAPEIAPALNISTHYLGTIMGSLVRAGWVHSMTGPTGGYRLAPLLCEGSMLDLIESMEGRIDPEACLHSDGNQPVERLCTLHEPWTRARDALLTELATTRLSDVFNLYHVPPCPT